MRTWIFLPFVLCGCSGAPFTAAFFDALSEADSGLAPPGAGGSDAGVDPGTDGASGGSGGSSDDSGTPNDSGGTVGSTGGISNDGSGGTVGSTGGAPDACALVTHDNGEGQTWQDCVPLGTYNQSQAMKACVASGAGLCLTFGGAQNWAIRGYSTDGSTVVGEWGYAGAGMGYVSPGDIGGVGNGPGSSHNVTWR